MAAPTALNPFEGPVFHILDSVKFKSKIQWGWRSTMFTKTQQSARVDRSLDRGVLRYLLILVLIAAGLFLLLTFLGIKAIDISLMLGSMLGNR
jgi:hypothetical protein